MTVDPVFLDLMARLCDGHNDAASDVFRRFVRRLLGLARRRLHAIVRPKVDPEDVVQSAFHSFFRYCGDGRFQVSNWTDLWRLLAVITARTCAKTNAHFHRPCRDVRKESTELPWEDPSAAARAVLAPGSTVEDAAVLVETIELLLTNLRTPEREMVLLCLRGYSVQEISQSLGCTRRKVQRVLKCMRHRLECLRAGGRAER